MLTFESGDQTLDRVHLSGFLGGRHEEEGIRTRHPVTLDDEVAIETSLQKQVGEVHVHPQVSFFGLVKRGYCMKPPQIQEESELETVENVVLLDAELEVGLQIGLALLPLLRTQGEHHLARQVGRLFEFLQKTQVQTFEIGVGSLQVPLD